MIEREEKNKQKWESEQRICASWLFEKINDELYRDFEFHRKRNKRWKRTMAKGGWITRQKKGWKIWGKNVLMMSTMRTSTHVKKYDSLKLKSWECERMNIEMVETSTKWAYLDIHGLD